MRSYLAITLGFLLVTLLQMSFFASFVTFPQAPNLIFILFFVLLFFSKDSQTEPLFLVALAGICLDFFSPTRFGLSILLLAGVYVVKKMASHFIENTDKQESLGYFLAIFLLGFLAYQSILQILIMRHIIWHTFWISASFQTLIAAAIFYLYKRFQRLFEQDRQLKLL